MFTLNQQDKDVQDFLNKNGIKYSVMYCGAVGGDWPHDLWRICFNGIGFEYKTGTGHRELLKDKRKSAPARIEHKRLAGLDAVSWPTQNSNSELSIAPTAASVLYCLLLDMQAGEQSFSDWCDDFGYSDDSIGSLNIYQACCNTAKYMRKAFTREKLDTLQTLLEDY